MISIEIPRIILFDLSEKTLDKTMDTLTSPNAVTTESIADLFTSLSYIDDMKSDDNFYPIAPDVKNIIFAIN